MHQINPLHFVLRTQSIDSSHLHYLEEPKIPKFPKVKTKIMNIFQFTKKPLIDAYTAFIRNVKRADDAIKIARTTKPAFDRFLQVIKQNRNKDKNISKTISGYETREGNKKIEFNRSACETVSEDPEIQTFAEGFSYIRPFGPLFIFNLKIFRDFWSTQIRPTKIFCFSGRQRKKFTSSLSGCQPSRKKVMSRR